MSTILKNEGIKHTITIHCDSKDLVQLLTAKYAKPKEKSDIFKLLKLRKLLGTVPTEAAKSTIATIRSLAESVTLRHIRGSLNPADALTKAVSAASNNL